MHRPLRGFDRRTGRERTHASHLRFSGGRAAWKYSWLLDRPIPMRKANPAFCDRSKSHKKLDPFDDRKMVHWLAENPFLVRSSAMSVNIATLAVGPYVARGVRA